MTPADCHEQLAPFGHITLDGIPIQGLVDTSASVSYPAYATWWHNMTTWGALCPYHQVIHGANGKPLPIVGHT